MLRVVLTTLTRPTMACVVVPVLGRFALDRPASVADIGSTTMRTLFRTLGLAVLVASAAPAAAQTWQTDPAFGARRDAYGPGVHMDATGRAYRDNPSDAWVFEPVRPNAYGPGVGSDSLGRPVTPDYGDRIGEEP
jgi:hypothetical protein